MEKHNKRFGIIKTVKNNLAILKLLSKGCPGKILYELIFAIINGLLSTAEIYFIGQAINMAQDGRPYMDIVIYIIIYIAIIIVYNLLMGVLNARLSPYFECQINKNIKLQLLKKASKADLECYENPEFYNKFSLAITQGVSRIDAVIASISGVISSVVALCSITAITYSIDPVILLFYFAPIFMFVFEKKCISQRYSIHKDITKISREKKYCIRTFLRPEYAREMRTTNIALPIMQRFRNAVDHSINIYQSNGMRLAVLSFAQDMYREVFTTLLVLIYAAYQTIVTQKIKYGDCVVLVKAIQTVSWNIQDIIQNLASFREHAFFWEDFCVFSEYIPKIKDVPGMPKAENGTIEFQHVSFRYANMQTDVLRDISFRINKGEKIAIVGANGAGKTTLIKLLLRLYDPTDGKIFMHGNDIKQVDLVSYRDLYACVLQDYHNLSMSVKENILLREEHDDDLPKINNAIQKCDLSERIEKMPHGIQTTVGKEFDSDGEVLSGGEAQKLALAHVFVENSPIVILDEPSSALDPIAEAKLFETIKNITEKRTIIWISHRLSSTIAADKVFYMENGQIIEQGSHDELIRLGGRYAELFRLQASQYLEEERLD